MRSRWRIESDNWREDGKQITSHINLETLRKTLEEEGPIIVEHRFYRGASTVERLIFEDFDAFAGYLDTKTWAGDSIWIWSYSGLCRDDNSIAQGKCPDENGCVPEKGAY